MDTRDRAAAVVSGVRKGAAGLLSGAAGLLCLAALAQPAPAQAASNYFILGNGEDVMYAGVGAGGSQTKADGLGTWIAGEDLRGSHVVGATNDFGFRIGGFREDACVMLPPVGGGSPAITFRGLAFVELDGLNGNVQPVFTNPSCPQPGPSFPLGNSGGFVPYGAPAGASISFIVAGLPPGAGPTPSSAMLLPNHGFLASGGPVGTATVAFSASQISIPIPSLGFCWAVQFSVIPSAIGLHDDIDGLWHWLVNSDDENQYWGFSDDELNLWQSNSVASAGGLTGVQTFPANADYAFLLLTPEPTTIASLAPLAMHGTGAFEMQTAGVANEEGVPLNPNGGFDVGRGSAAVSFSGTAGVPNPVTHLGNQNPTTEPGIVPTLGFFTWDNGGDGDGSVRLTWLSIDVLGLRKANPALEPGILAHGGLIRVPVVSSGFPQPVMDWGHRTFGHVTQLGFPDPWGFPVGAFGVAPIAGASWQVPLGPLPAACAGTAMNLTYGTSGRLGGVGTAGPKTFDPSIADTSGTRELYLFD
jgi:hypothetical protein